MKICCTKKSTWCFHYIFLRKAIVFLLNFMFLFFLLWKLLTLTVADDEGYGPSWLWISLLKSLGKETKLRAAVFYIGIGLNSWADVIIAFKGLMITSGIIAHPSRTLSNPYCLFIALKNFTSIINFWSHILKWQK